MPRKGWHSKKAIAHREAVMSKIRRYKKAHGIQWKTPLTAAQNAEARGLNNRNSVAGVMSLDAIKGARPPVPGSQGKAQAHIMGTRVAFAHDLVKLVERSTRTHDRTLYDLAQSTVAVVNRLLNGKG